MPSRVTIPFQRTWDADGIPVLQVSISLPCPEGKDKAARRIRRYYQLQARAFLRYCEGTILPEAKAALALALEESRPFQCREAALSYRVTYQGGSLLSLYTQSLETGPEPLLLRRGDTWDLAEAAPVPLGRFFRRCGQWRRVFYDAACADLSRRQRAGAARLREDWRRQVKRCLNPRDFYLTEEGLVFFLPMYAIAGPREGIPAFTIPWPTLRAPGQPEK